MPLPTPEVISDLQGGSTFPSNPITSLADLRRSVLAWWLLEEQPQECFQRQGSHLPPCRRRKTCIQTLAVRETRKECWEPRSPIFALLPRPVSLHRWQRWSRVRSGSCSPR